jgi:hypothetical protein
MFQWIQLPFMYVGMEHVRIYLFPCYIVIRPFFMNMFYNVLVKACEVLIITWLRYKHCLLLLGNWKWEKKHQQYTHTSSFLSFHQLCGIPPLSVTFFGVYFFMEMIFCILTFSMITLGFPSTSYNDAMKSSFAFLTNNNCKDWGFPETSHSSTMQWR